MAEDEEKRAESARWREEMDRQQRLSDLRAVAETPSGRRFLARVVFEFGGLQELAYARKSRQHAFNDGQRAVGKAVDRELYLQARQSWGLMHFERTERLKNEPVDPSPNKTDQ